MDEKGLIQIYCGPGKGKTSVAIGQAVRAVGHGKRAIVIQFLKGKATTQLDYLSALEPDIRLFRFEKKDKYYEDLTEEEKQELDYKLQMAVSLPGEKPAVTITYFVPDKKKAGGYRQRNTCYGEGRTDKSGYGSGYYSECRLDLKDGILSVRPVGYRIDEEMFYRKMTGKN